MRNFLFVYLVIAAASLSLGSTNDYSRFAHSSIQDARDRAASEALERADHLSATVPGFTADDHERVRRISEEQLLNKYLSKANYGLYAFVECPTHQLTNAIPSSARWSRKTVFIEGTTNTVEVAKTLDEYLMFKRESNDGLRTAFRLAAMERPTLRNDPVNAADLDGWVTNLFLFGSTPDDWMNIAEWQVLMDSTNYTATQD